jgi:hypothetical protein
MLGIIYSILILGLVLSITFRFSPLNCIHVMYVLYHKLVEPVWICFGGLEHTHLLMPTVLSASSRDICPSVSVVFFSLVDLTVAVMF